MDAIKNRKNELILILCYAIWGFQPLYWSVCSHLNSYTIMAFRVIMAAVFSLLILAVTKKLGELKALFHDKKTMKFLLPAVVFLFLDWTVFIVAVNSGHVLDVSLGYYLNPLLLFALGIIIYKEKCTGLHIVSLAIAAAGLIISTVAFGSFPLLSVIIAINWAVYAALKKNVNVSGVVSIAAETLIMTPFAIAFLLIFKRADICALNPGETLFLIGSGLVTALPMFLYSHSVIRFPLIVMCFAQYLSPTFNLICGLITGETFSSSQIISFSFFIAAIIVFTLGELKNAAKTTGG